MPDDPYSRVDYRRFVAWPQRIEREWPFLQKVLGSAPSRRVLDLGCGTGEHARFLATKGFSVVGIDASESMLAKAREGSTPAGVELVAETSPTSRGSRQDPSAPPCASATRSRTFRMHPR
jgi:2-polyprenyl-3-methyl-5-hydroxy-6-metoxy-1,4-benzoquinol methylase